MFYNYFLFVGYFPVYLSSSLGHIFGGEPLIISGPTFSFQDIIHCIFGDIQTNGSYVSSQQCVCIVPAASNTGVIDLAVKITRRTGSLYGHTKYRYSKLIYDIIIYDQIL